MTQGFPPLAGEMSEGQRGTQRHGMAKRFRRKLCKVSRPAAFKTVRGPPAPFVERKGARTSEAM